MICWSAVKLDRSLFNYSQLFYANQIVFCQRFKATVAIIFYSLTGKCPLFAYLVWMFVKISPSHTSQYFCRENADLSVSNLFKQSIFWMWDGRRRRFDFSNPVKDPTICYKCSLARALPHVCYTHSLTRVLPHICFTRSLTRALLRACLVIIFYKKTETADTSISFVQYSSRHPQWSNTTESKLALHLWRFYVQQIYLPALLKNLSSLW